MKNIDPKTAARVWERVQAPASTADAAAIQVLLTEEIQDSLIYARLAKRLPPAQAAIARQMAQQEQTHITCLKGIYAMITGSTPRFSATAPADDPIPIVLRRCYGREMRCLAQYEARGTDPQYGHIFRKLAHQEQEHCQKLLELLGTLTK